MKWAFSCPGRKSSQEPRVIMTFFVPRDNLPFLKVGPTDLVCPPQAGLQRQPACMGVSFLNLQPESFKTQHLSGELERTSRQVSSVR